MSWISTGTAAKILGVSTQTVRNLHRAGRLPGRRTGFGKVKAILYERDAVERLKAERDGCSTGNNAQSAQ